MNRRRTPNRREEGEVANEIIFHHDEQFPIVDQEDVNEVVPPPEPQGP